MPPEENEYRERIRTRTVRRTALSGKNRPEPPGVGGWLADCFLILVRPVLDAIFQSAVFNRQWQENPSILHDIIWNRHRQIVWTVCFIMSALSVSAGVVFWKIRRSAAVRYAIAVLWIASPGYYAVIMFAWLLFGHPVLWPSLSSCRVGKICLSPLSRHCSGQPASMTRNVSATPAGTMNSDPAGKKREGRVPLDRPDRHVTPPVFAPEAPGHHMHRRARPEANEKT